MSPKKPPKNKGQNKQQKKELRPSPSERLTESDDIEDAEIISEEEPDEEASEESDPEATAENLPAEIEPEHTRALSISDPLRQYMEEVKRYPLMSPEEEFQHAVKLRDTGDLAAAKMLVSANLRLVVKIAFEYRSMYSNVLDLIQEGNIGLMKAVSKFDPTKGARLGYYASWWIRSYILKYLIDNFRLVKIGTTQAQKKLFYHLIREKERLEAQGMLAGPKLLADRLHVREKDVIEMQQRLGGQGAEVSIDAPIKGDESGTETHGAFIVDETESADDALMRNQLLRLLENSLPAFRKTLKDKELNVLDARILAEEPKTLQEVANQYNLTRERVRQIETKVIEKLKDFLTPVLKGRKTKSRSKRR